MFIRPTSFQVVLDTTKVQIFKQITTCNSLILRRLYVVLDTTKVQIFKQITTVRVDNEIKNSLF